MTAAQSARTIEHLEGNAAARVVQGIDAGVYTHQFIDLMVGSKAQKPGWVKPHHISWSRNIISQYNRSLRHTRNDAGTFNCRPRHTNRNTLIPNVCNHLILLGLALTWMIGGRV